MVGTIIIEILILWIFYIIYMAILVHKRGPVGAIFFYPKVMQERVIELRLITQKEIKQRRNFAFVLLLVLMILVPLIMIVFVNGTRSYWDCCWQYYVLFLGAELFDWLVIDTIWVALSDWWLIPGTEDLNDTWHSPKVKRWKMLKLIPFSVPVAAIIGGLYWLIGLLIG
ncbi:MAG: hypothetical protein IJ740_08700 [Ruminococcus sp.]|nr:hypothetical protein [Ruminococcus sp.]